MPAVDYEQKIMIGLTHKKGRKYSLFSCGCSCMIVIFKCYLAAPWPTLDVLERKLLLVAIKGILKLPAAFHIV